MSCQFQFEIRCRSKYIDGKASNGRRVALNKSSDEFFGDNSKTYFTKCGRGDLQNQDRAMVVSPSVIEGASSDANIVIGVFNSHRKGGELVAEIASQKLHVFLADVRKNNWYRNSFICVEKGMLSDNSRIPCLWMCGLNCRFCASYWNHAVFGKCGWLRCLSIAIHDANEDTRILFKTNPHTLKDYEEQARIESIGVSLMILCCFPQMNVLVLRAAWEI